jgi:hypothetical protein
MPSSSHGKDSEGSKLWKGPYRNRFAMSEMQLQIFFPGDILSHVIFLTLVTLCLR